MSIQLSKNGENQSRSMTCLPEKYIYGWICSLNSDNKDLLEYKQTCYDLLYQHFHGTITNRKELIQERVELKKRIDEVKLQLKENDELYQQLSTLQNQRKQISHELNKMDSELAYQTELNFN